MHRDHSRRPDHKARTLTRRTARRFKLAVRLFPGITLPAGAQLPVGA